MPDGEKSDILKTVYCLPVKRASARREKKDAMKQDVEKFISALSVVGQLGFTVAVPPVVLILLARWLQMRFAFGSWVMILAILLGLCSAASGAVDLIRGWLRVQRKKDEAAREAMFRPEPKQPPQP